MRAMKDSGIEWIGEIPEEWGLLKARFLFRQRTGKGNKTPVLLAATQKSGMIPQSDIEGVVQVKEETDLQQFRTVHNGDYVISLRSFQGGFEYSSYEGVCSPAYQVFYSIDNLNSSYYKLLFKSDGFIEKMNSLTVGIREGKNILYKDFASSYIPVPKIVEQQRIASFLDLKCSKIDEYVSRQQQVIEKLKAYKQAVITEAVTKGLDPDVPMKDSGVEWIGKIPEEWNVFTLGKLLSGIKDGTHSSYNRVLNGEMLLSAKNVYNDGLRITDNESEISEEDYKTIVKCGYPRLGDIMLTTIGGSIGRVLAYTFDKIYAFQRSVIFIRKNSSYLTTKFLVYVLLSEYVQSQMMIAANASAQNGVYSKDIYKYLVAVPSTSKQRQIASYLDTKCAAIDAAITRKQELIDKMTEYKKSLIYEAVTGKMEV